MTSYSVILICNVVGKKSVRLKACSQLSFMPIQINEKEAGQTCRIF